jgi:hypothetical protein
VALKAAQTLAQAGRWLQRGRSERVLWGECRGSGSSPYQVQIDLLEPAFKCSCPSRKIPCKHALALLLLFAGQPAALPVAEPPARVVEWLAARDERREKQPRPKGTADPQATARRAAERQARMADGFLELERWLSDLVRHGLASVQGRPISYWDAAAARLTDAQAPGAARMVRELAAVASSGSGWPERLLARVGHLYLLANAFQRWETLPAAAQADLAAAAGWAQRQEELRDGEGLWDQWLVAGQRVEVEERLQAQRTWLWGQESGRPALALDFAHGRNPLDKSLLPGTTISAELVFFPGAFPLRALIKERRAASYEASPAGFPTIEAALAFEASALARNPWLPQLPFLLAGVTPLRLGESWSIADRVGHRLVLHRAFGEGWQLMALSGGHPLTLFGEWDGTALWPLAVWSDGRMSRLGAEG